MSNHRSDIARDLRSPKYRKRIEKSFFEKRQRAQAYDTLQEYHDYYTSMDRLLDEYAEYE